MALRAFPATHTGQLLALVFGGVLLTPLVPQSVARVAAIAPLAHELSRALGYAPRSKGSASLGFAGLIGYWYFSSVFLTGLATNFFVVGLLSPDDQLRFGWLGWLVAAAARRHRVPGRRAGRPARHAAAGRSAQVSAETIRRQTRILGAISRQERVAIAGLAVLVVGLAAQPVLRIEPAWLAIAALVIVTAGVVDRERFRSSIDWGFLAFLGVVLGSGAVLQSGGVDKWISSLLLSATAGVSSPGLLVIVFAVLVMLSRIILPSRPAMVLLSLALVPAAPALGISPWVAGFVVLVASNVWVLPYQGLEYLIAPRRDGRRGVRRSSGHPGRCGVDGDPVGGDRGSRAVLAGDGVGRALAVEDARDLHRQHDARWRPRRTPSGAHPSRAGPSRRSSAVSVRLSAYSSTCALTRSRKGECAPSCGGSLVERTRPIPN